jgi:hypothetical protein
VRKSFANVVKMHTPSISNLRLRNALSLHTAFLTSAVSAGTSPFGLESAFSLSVEISVSLWSQIKSGRSIGDKLARQFEVKCGKPRGWLDTEHDDTAPDPAEERFVEACRTAWRSADRERKRELKQLVKTRLLAP